MKTWQAALVQVAIGAAQTASGVAFFTPNTPVGALSNTGVQLGIQAALTALNIWVASKNSNTDPNGNKLVPVSPNVYKTKTS